MPITVDPAAEYAKMGTTPPPSQKMQDLEEVTTGMLPQGKPIEEGTVIRQHVGRGQPASMMVVPPQTAESRGPQVAVVPPTGGGKTSIGTFVEPSSIQPTLQQPTNPLTAAPPPTNSGLVSPPVTEEAPKPVKKKKFDLVQAILDHMWELGGEKSEQCQKFYGRSDTQLAKYFKDPGMIPLSLVQKFLGKRPGAVAEIEEDLEPHFSANGREGSTESLPTRGKTSVMVCAPVLERPTLPFLWNCIYLAKKYELGFSIQADTMIARSRNMLADRFLKSNAEWSLWIDGDMACPIANKDWFKWITGSEQVPDIVANYDVLTRLQMHGKPIVGGVYASRKYHGRLVIQPDVRPRSEEDRTLANEIRRGTASGLKEVNWIGFGCALVHRRVFLEIQQRFPELAPEHEFAPWRFFQPAGDEGEDEAFCERVRACGVPIWLDTQLVCAHIGNFAFLPEHTAGIPTV
jgi:hypothetical protein